MSIHILVLCKEYHFSQVILVCRGVAVMVVVVRFLAGGAAGQDNIALESVAQFSSRAQPRSGCRTKYRHVSVVKQVPSFSKHCTTVDDTKVIWQSHVKSFNFFKKWGKKLFSV